MKLHEFEPVGELPTPRAMRRDEAQVLTCAACGCRLTPREHSRDGGGYGPDAAWRHFHGNTPETDARGCRVECVESPHRTVVEQAGA